MSPTNGHGASAERCATAFICARPGEPGLESTVRVVRELADPVIVPATDPCEVLARHAPDVIVIDDSIGAETGDAVLDAARGVPTFVVLLGNGEREARSREGRFPDCVVVPKPVDPTLLRSVCALALEFALLRRRVRTLELAQPEVAAMPDVANGCEDDLEPGETYGDLLAWSRSMRDVIATLRHIEASDVSVLVHGETGTGKDIVAQAIHARSRRQRAPFVAVNLGAITDQLRESELFGHVRGAFTGASETRGGLFAEAHRGTIFLDEIGEASPALQVALLRVLEEGTITPVGGDRPRRVDVRVISATNQDLRQLVLEGRFRRDLLYRLNVFPLRLPPLRERPDDIFPLACHFLAAASRALGREPTGISREGRTALEARPWEGNVRELRNVMERAALVCTGGLIVARDLDAGTSPDLAADEASIALPPHGATFKALERQIFTKTLELAAGNQSRAARILGMHESTFRFRLRKAGVGTRVLS